MNQTFRLKQMLSLGICLAVITILSGCGNGYDIGLYPVTGTVTIDGNVVEGAMVDFQPTGEDRAPRGANGATDSAGQYVLYFLKSKGCPAGDFNVQFSVPQEKAELGLKKLAQVEKVTVTPGGDNTFDFTLTSE